jgi:hypothetical protein
MFDLLLLFRCFRRWGVAVLALFSVIFILALAFLPSGWGLASDSGTVACLELLW